MQKTIINLSNAFVGESQARNRYDMYAKIAKKEGYEQISAIFTETATQEQEHAKQLFRIINQLRKDNPEDSGLEEIKIEADVPVMLENTEKHLEAAINGEREEYEEMYPEFARVAREEGLEDIAVRLAAIGEAEDHHRERYQKLLDGIRNGSLFKKEESIDWVCRKCGYKHNGETPPEVCPSCSHPVAYFQVQAEIY